jgi:two-component system, OmpR family, heavy metal sensor histidine kinase CusS
MSSNNVEPQKNSSRWSMARWLGTYFTLSVFSLLAVASLFLYWELQRNVAQDSRDSLMHKVQVLTHLVQEQPFNRAGIEQEAHEEAEVSAESQAPFFLRVFEANGQLIAETPDMDSILPRAVFPVAHAADSQERRWQSTTGSTYLLASSFVTARDDVQGWHIQAAFDISAAERLLARFRRDIALVLLVGLLIAAPIGAWIIRRGLKPIDNITRATETIGAQQLHQRINAGHWPAELVTLATEFDRMLDRLQESFERLKQFSADLAHELRTPINNLMGESQVALSRTRSDTEYVRVLQSSLEEHGRLASMIDSMLFLAQADQARTLLSLRQLDARAELQAVADFYQALADEQEVDLVCSGEAQVIADPMLLRRAISNLLSNALKHTPRGRRITLCATVDDSQVTLSVIDSGIGIAAEHLPKLGDRFYRVDPARTNSSAGSGLGLAIVRSIMTLHNGKLHIHSEAGSGTTVSLIFTHLSEA